MMERRRDPDHVRYVVPEWDRFRSRSDLGQAFAGDGLSLHCRRRLDSDDAACSPVSQSSREAPCACSQVDSEIDIRRVRGDRGTPYCEPILRGVAVLRVIASCAFIVDVWGGHYDIVAGRATLAAQFTTASVRCAQRRCIRGIGGTRGSARTIARSRWPSARRTG